jgi:putative oxidoreductase
MRQLFSSFPHGAPGIGLLLLRLASGSTSIYQGVTALAGGAPSAPAAFHTLLIFLGILLLAGLWTPVAGALVAVATIWEMVSHPSWRPPIASIAIMAAALALIGPGAWSVDAWLYGWKQIKISVRTQNPADSAARCHPSSARVDVSSAPKCPES